MSAMKLLLTDLVSGVNHVPSNYVRPIADRPNLMEVEKSEGSNGIPVIDLRDLYGPNHANVITQIGLACQHHGFFQVLGVPEKMIENVLQIAREFFRLPESERLKNYSDDPSKTTRLSTSFNVKTEKVSNWRDFLRLHCYPLQNYVHEWPTNPPSFREEVAEYCTSVRGLALRLLGAISESLGLETDYIDNQLGNHGQHMAMNYYPPCPEPELTFGLPGHTDPNLITILLQDDVPGLQVLHNGKWVTVNPIPNTFIINIGDQMQVISNDRYKSVLHRAVVNSDKERISIPTFYCPSPDAMIGPAPELIDNEDNKPAPEFIIHGCDWIKAEFGKIKAKALDMAKKTKEVGQDDPRRIIHSLKVGLALTLVSLLYYLRPLYNWFGSSGMGAVFTVVVVFEFTVGATLSKSMNRVIATILAGALGVGANNLASLVGDKGQPIILAFCVFLFAAAFTYARFFLHIKARYDYGVLIFILTFSLVSISGYRVDQIVEVAYQRLSAILLGVAICIIISVVVCPVWAGQDLHNLVATNLELLSNFLEGFEGVNFGVSGDGDSNMGPKEDKSFNHGYKSVLNTRNTEESLANFAWWEPGHESFQFRHPWKQYLEIGALTRQCAHHLEDLQANLNYEIQAPTEFQRKIREPCMKMSLESGKALKELAMAIKTFSQPSCVDVYIESSKRAMDELKTVTKAVSRKEYDLLKIIPSLTVSSILTDIVKCVEKISESIHELSRQAQFEE